MRILLVEDNPSDAWLIRDMLRESGGGSFSLEEVDQLEAAFEVLGRGETDAVLLDLSLPDSAGLQTLWSLRARRPELPVIVMTGLHDETTALRAVSSGAQDYLVKGRFDSGLLYRSVRYAVERKRSEGALRESEERFRTLVDSSLVGICILQNGRIAFQNSEQRRLFGPMPDSFDFRDFKDYHPDDAQRFKDLCEAVCGGTLSPHETELRFFPRGGGSQENALRWVHCRTIPIRYRGREAVLMNMVDVTRAREMEHLADLREKMAVLGHIAGCMAHEIRNPLSGINIYLSALDKQLENPGLRGGEEASEARKILRRIWSATERIESVVRKAMDISKPSLPDKRLVDLNLAIVEAVDFYSVALRRLGVTIEAPRLEPLPKCHADPRMIVQVILNLLMNAGQAMEKLSGAKLVRLSSCVEGDHIVIRVADSGPGIPLAKREKVFEPFHTTKREGYGLGLSFCKRVIEDHKGRITAGESEWGGAEFRIELSCIGR